MLLSDTDHGILAESLGAAEDPEHQMACQFSLTLIVELYHKVREKLKPMIAEKCRIYADFGHFRDTICQLLI